MTAKVRLGAVHWNPHVVHRVWVVKGGKCMQAIPESRGVARPYPWNETHTAGSKPISLLYCRLIGGSKLYAKVIKLIADKL